MDEIPATDVTAPGTLPAVLGSALPDPSSRADMRALYLDLMKRCLCDFIYVDDPLSAMIPLTDLTRRGMKRRRWIVGVAIAAARRMLAHYHIRLAEYPQGRPIQPREAAEMRARGADWPGRAHTMIGLKRLDNLQHCIETALRDGVPGDLIETGAWRGGASIFMRAVLQAHGDTARKVWVADSFDGLPPPDARYPADGGADWHKLRFLAVPRAEVERNFSRYGLLDGQVEFLEGWFEDSLHAAPIDRLAVLRLDGDMYASTHAALAALYAKVSPGGFAVIDDYALGGCRAAVDEFRARHRISEPIVAIDDTGVFWRRSR